MPFVQALPRSAPNIRFISKQISSIPLSVVLRAGGFFGILLQNCNLRLKLCNFTSAQGVCYKGIKGEMPSPVSLNGGRVISALEVFICAVVLICEADLAYCTEHFVLQAKKRGLEDLAQRYLLSRVVGRLSRAVAFRLNPV